MSAPEPAEAPDAGLMAALARQAREEAAKAVSCPFCPAKAGERCISLAEELRDPHDSRLRVVGIDPYPEPEEEDEIAQVADDLSGEWGMEL